MRIMYQRCCGIDVHKKMIVACLLMISDQGVQKEIQMFSIMLSDLFRLRDWLTAQGCEAVAMESTGVYWASQVELLILMERPMCQPKRRRQRHQIHPRLLRAPRRLRCSLLPHH